MAKGGDVEVNQSARDRIVATTVAVGRRVGLVDPKLDARAIAGFYWPTRLGKPRSASTDSAPSTSCSPR